MKAIKKWMSICLSTCMGLSSFQMIAPTMVHASSDEVVVETSGNTYTIGNGYIKRTFDITDGKVSTTNITNYRTDSGETIFTPEAGSEEFVISLMDAEIPYLDQSGWSAEADSYQTTDVNGDGPGSNLIDGNPSTIWHSRYNDSGAYGDTSFPYSVIVTFDEVETFAAFAYVGRSGSTNGHINGYQLYANTGSSTLDFESADSEWTLISEGNFDYSDGDTCSVNLDQAYSASQVKLVALSEREGRAFASGAELHFYENAFTTSDDGILSSSDLTLNGTPTIQDIEGGQILTFTFEPLNVNGVDYTIEEVITMYDGDSFMRKHLNISVPMEQSALAGIEYIDLENMNIASSDLVEGEYWTIPEQANNSDMANMNGDFLELGQPYYLAAMYWGSEFPQTENKIREENGFIRYWYGKTLAKDEYFEYNMNNQAGSMTTWPAVVGAARSKDYAVCQSDFYEYIETIATPTEFRQQFNTWYDYMKDITAENIRESFYQVEKGFTQYGVSPLDSYVVDDGWMDYSTFWDFNDKFPNELYDSSLQVEQMGSNFGLWLGPRGGYGTQTQIANAIANAGLGSVNAQSGNDINISDARYLNKLRDDIFVDYQEKFHINYWKLDGMLLHPSTVASPYYVTGNTYYTISETYERWTDMWETMRENEWVEGDLWLNVTSYTNPSPWFLQWANSIWMQNTGDVGYTEEFDSSDEQQALTYRDNCYYNFVNTRQWQMPMKYFYNHDPVYGSTAHIGPGKPNQIYFSTDELREYLYMLGTRGTAFWEYYYSPSMFDDEKWQVNAEAANWIEDNFHILQKSKMFGGQPGNGDVYGYSCWNGNEGIVSIRNPHNTTKTYTLTYDRLVGVTEGIENLYGKVVLGDIKWQNDEEMYYGKEVTYTLEPHETLIMYYGAKDTTSATIESIHGEGTTLDVTFNEAIREADVDDISVEGYTITNATLNPDKRTVTLTLSTSLVDASDVVVKVSGIQDIAGNTSSDETKDDYYENDIVNAVISQTLDGTAIEKGNKYSIDGIRDFSIHGELTTTSKNATLIEQEGAYTLSIDEEGYLVFEFNGMQVNSKYEERTLQSDDSVTSTIKGMFADGNKHQFSAVKEANGMIKVYIDGLLCNSTYDETKVNPVVSKGAVRVGEGVVGQLDYITLYDNALGYDEVEDLVNNDTPTNVALASANANVRITAWMNDGVPTQISEKNESQTRFANINDGSRNSDYYLELTDTANGQNVSRYIQIDLGSVYNLTKLNMARYFKDNRTYGATVIALSETEDFANKTIIYNSDTNNVHGLGAGSDATYQETQAGKDFVLATPTKAQYIRVYVYGRDGSTSDHFVEFEAYGTKEATSLPNVDRGDESIDEEVVGKDALIAAIASAQPIYEATNDANTYTSGSWTTFTSAYETATSLVDDDSASQEEVNQATTALTNATSGLVDLTALKAKIAEANTYEAANYTEASYQVLQEKITAAESVLTNANATQSEVTNAIDDISQAISALISNATQVQNLSATCIDYKSIQLTWDAVSGASSYEIYRINTKTGEWILVNTSTTKSFNITGVKTGKEYTYKVRAIISVDGETITGEYSQECKGMATLQGAPTVTLSVDQTKFHLTWDEVIGATRYIVYRKYEDGEYKKVLTLGKDVREYTSKSMTQGTYTYKIVAARYDGEERTYSADSNEVCGDVAFVAPTLSISESTDTSVTLTWNEVEGTPYYEVYRSNTMDDGYRRIKVTNTTTYINKGLSTDTSYFYKVRAYRVHNGNRYYSDFSNIVEK